MSPFHIRTTPLSSDPRFILSAFDSTLPHLAETGSAGQWGTQPRSTQETYITRITSQVEKARTGGSEGDAVFIAEVPFEGIFNEEEGEGEDRIRIGEGKRRMLKVAAAVVEGEFPGYVSEGGNLEGEVRGAVGRADFLYLSVLVGDFRAGGLRKGAGAVLVRSVREYARRIGKGAVYCDCWAGNGGKLVGFYRGQGFGVVGGFEARKGDVVWPGMLLRMDVDGDVRE